MAEIPRLALAPMQDVSTLAFWRAMESRGGPDVYVTEYFRVHFNSRPEKKILASINETGTDKPILAQMIGAEPEQMARAAREIQEQSQCAGIDVNLGCPSPRVCRAAGGALLKRPELVRRIVEALRPVVGGLLTVKTRLGFESPEEFDELLELFSGLPIDGLAIHGRTVRERYQSEVHVGAIAEAVQSLGIPVQANGSIVSRRTARAMHRATGADGLMIGRGAIRNPFLFQQIRQSYRGEEVIRPRLSDQLRYVEDLYEGTARAARRFEEIKHIQRMKRFMNYIASGIGEGAFSQRIKRVQTAVEFWEVCGDHLDSSAEMPDEPEEDGRLFCGFRGFLARDQGGAFG